VIAGVVVGVVVALAALVAGGVYCVKVRGLKMSDVCLPTRLRPSGRDDHDQVSGGLRPRGVVPNVSLKRSRSKGLWVENSNRPDHRCHKKKRIFQQVSNLLLLLQPAFINPNFPDESDT